MTHSPSWPAEPALSPLEGTGANSDTWGRLSGVLERVRDWAGSTRQGILVGGSHATGGAVWAHYAGRTVALSDLDLFVIVPSHADARAAEARVREARPALAAHLLELGLAAPLDVGFYTPDDLAALPARPATLELRRHARLVEGDPALADRVPTWRPDQVPFEELLLLLENRAFELLLAWGGLDATLELDRLRARHGVLKCALDLATALTLAGGELPDSAAERVRWATSRAGAPSAAAGTAPADRVLANAPDLPELWERALAWRSGRVRALPPSEARAEWLQVARAWTATWLELSHRGGPTGDVDPYRQALAVARRARLRRRMRTAVVFRTRSGLAPSLSRRLAFALCGTPQHRLGGAAAVLLLSAVHGGGRRPALGPAAAHALARLGVLSSEDGHEWERAARALVRAWDLWVLDGQRTAEAR